MRSAVHTLIAWQCLNINSSILNWYLTALIYERSALSVFSLETLEGFKWQQ